MQQVEDPSADGLEVHFLTATGHDRRPTTKDPCLFCPQSVPDSHGRAQTVTDGRTRSGLATSSCRVRSRGLNKLSFLWIQYQPPKKGGREGIPVFRLHFLNKLFREFSLGICDRLPQCTGNINFELLICDSSIISSLLHDSKALLKFFRCERIFQ